MNKLIIGFILAGLACIGAGVIIGANICDKKRNREFDFDDEDSNYFKVPEDEVKINVDAMDISSSEAVQKIGRAHV